MYINITEEAMLW